MKPSIDGSILPDTDGCTKALVQTGGLTEMQSAMGRVLLRKLPQSIEMRRNLASILTERFSEIPALRVATPA